MPRSPSQVFDLGDAMGVTPLNAEAAQKEIADVVAREPPAMEAFRKIDKLERRSKGGFSPAELVAGSLQSAAVAAASAAAPLASNISSLTAVVPVQTVAASLTSAAAAGHSSAVATIATITAAVQASWSRDRKARGQAEPACSESPTEWYVADDPASHTRFFMIQGSDNLDHWRVNLTFDPCVFEDPELGVKVCPCT